MSAKITYSISSSAGNGVTRVLAHSWKPRSGDAGDRDQSDRNGSRGAGTIAVNVTQVIAPSKDHEIEGWVRSGLRPHFGAPRSPARPLQLSSGRTSYPLQVEPFARLRVLLFRMPVHKLPDRMD